MPVADIDISYLFYSFHEFFSAISKVNKFTKRWDEDFVSTLNSKYSVIMLILLALMVSTKQYVGDPIVCMPPAEFTFSMVEYTNNLCWVSNTYYLPMTKRPLLRHEVREDLITYYQWIPLILMTQAILFFIPSLVWRIHSVRSGLSVNKVNLLLSGVENFNPDIRDKAVNYLSKHIDRSISYQQEYRTGILVKWAQLLAYHCSLCCGKTYGNYLTVLYLTVKVLYCVNSLGQLFLLAEVIGDGYYWYGVDALYDIIEKKYHNSKLFPRVTLCDMELRQFSNVQMFTVQCSLPINLFNEKVYLFIWFWLCLLTVVNFYSVIVILWNSFYTNRRTFIKKNIQIFTTGMGIVARITNKEIQRFLQKYLRQDGVLILRMIEMNTNDAISAEVVGHLFEKFLKRQVATKDREKSQTPKHSTVCWKSDKYSV